MPASLYRRWVPARLLWWSLRMDQSTTTFAGIGHHMAAMLAGDGGVLDPTTEGPLGQMYLP